MGLFNNPKPGVAPFELDRVFRTLKSRHRFIPHDQFERWKIAAQGYLNDAYRTEKGLSRDELDNYMSAAESVTLDQYKSVLPKLRGELEKAIKGTYGGALGY